MLLQRLTEYHAHVYFNPIEIAKADKLCLEASNKFDVTRGRMHNYPLGPHPVGSCQLAFSSNIFGDFVQWLIANRNGLTIFIHGLSGDDLRDHTEYVIWLGSSVELNLDVFTKPFSIP